MSKNRHDKQYLIPTRDYKRLHDWVSNYPRWTREYEDPKNGEHFYEVTHTEKTRAFQDPTANRAIMMAERSYKINLVNKIIHSLTDDTSLQDALLQNVAFGATYSQLSHNGLKVDKDLFFQKRRQFFWDLRKARLHF